MSQNLVQKEYGWVQRFSQAVVDLLNDADSLTALCAEFSNDGYESGGTNALTDANVQNYLPAATADLVFSAEGALSNSNAILATIAASRQSLEWMRP